MGRALKLFLSSIGIPKKAESVFLGLIEGKGKPSLGFITNAADNYPADEKEYISSSLKRFSSLGIEAEEIDLKSFVSIAEMQEQLSKFDIIWLSGGNTPYLRYIARETGFDNIVKDLIQSGIIYGGESSGAIIATPTIKYVDFVDDPSEAPVFIESGFCLVDFALVPHWADFADSHPLRKMKIGLEDDGREVITLTDQQAIVIKGSERTVIK